MQIDDSELRETLKLVLKVEREHLFGVRTGSASARKRELERMLDDALTQLVHRIETGEAAGAQGKLI